MPQSVASKRLKVRQTKAYLDAIKSANKCSVCGEGRSACLDFHHLDPSEKGFSLSNVKCHGIDTVKAEVKKCIVICANCHRILHAEEKAEAISVAKADEIFPLFD
jgi:hypothetical protein